MVVRRKKAAKSAIIVWKNVILLKIAQNLQKTSVNLGNFYAGDWWLWGGCCQSALHLLPGLILRRPETSKGLIW